MKKIKLQFQKLLNFYQGSDLAYMFLVVVSYVFFAKIVLGYFSAKGVVTIVWPPSGIALAALLLGGKKYWPAAWLGAFFGTLFGGSSLPVSLFIACGNTAEAVLAFYLLNAKLKILIPFENISSYFRFLLFAVLIAPIIAALNGSLTLIAFEIITKEQFLTNALTWWQGDALGVLLITPAIMAWRYLPSEWLSHKLESILLLVVSIIVGQVVFLDAFSQYFGAINRGYWMYFIITWVAILLGLHGVTLVAIILSVQALTGAANQVGFFAKDIAATGLENFWFYTVIVVIVGESLSTIFAVNKKVKAQLKQAKLAADAANTAKSSFLASMSHEIRTPLNSVVGLTEVLLDSNLNEEQRRLMKIANAAGESLLYLINDILDFSKVEAGALRLEHITFLFNEQIDNCVSIINTRIREKNLRLVWKIDPTISTHVLGDPTRLRQVLINLMSNAAKFSDNGEITLTVKPASANEGKYMLLFAVSDQGIGIPADKFTSIFQRFNQLDSSITRRFGGSGLGLAISKKLVELMGGRIWVESELGKGSTFYFTAKLPAVAATDVITHTSAQAPNLGAININTVTGKGSPSQDMKIKPKKPLDILLAEDSRDNRLLVEVYLKGLPHKLVSVENGAAAVEIFKKQHFDLVLMDVQMPVMDGYTATREIRHYEDLLPEKKHIPILALTAHAFEDDVAASKNAGCNEHVTKPISKTKFLQVLEKYS